MSKTIRISCDTKYSIDPANLKALQGDLKDLSKENYEKLKKEILTEGFDAPFFVWCSGTDGNYVLDGHQRLRVIMKMIDEGYDIDLLPYVPIQAKDIHEAKRKLLGYASQYGEVTSQGLYEFLEGSDIEFDEMDSRYRFPEINTEEFKDEFYQETKSSEGEDDIPEVAESCVVYGDLFRLGSHRLLCGDATDRSMVERLMNDENADMVFTDPPYNLKFEYNSYDDDKSHEEYQSFCFEWFKNVSAASDKQIITPGTQNLTMWMKMKDPKAIGIWIKKNWMSGGLISNLQQWEPILFYGPCERSRPSDLFEINRVYQKDVGENHTCPKQVELVQDIVRHWSTDSVLDVFMGSGTTLIACEKTNRRCFGMEIDPHYCDVIIERWMKFSGKEVFRQESDGSLTPWNEILSKTQSIS